MLALSIYIKSFKSNTPSALPVKAPTFVLGDTFEYSGGGNIWGRASGVL